MILTTIKPTKAWMATECAARRPLAGEFFGQLLESDAALFADTGSGFHWLILPYQGGLPPEGGVLFSEHY